MDWNTQQVETTTTLATVSGATTIAAGAILAGTVIDVRQWAGFYLTCTANQANNSYAPVVVQLNWYLDRQGTQLIYSDVYEFLAFRAAGAFITTGGKLNGQDVLHGPFMSVSLMNNGSTSVTAGYTLTGTTRQLPGPYYREQNQTNPPDDTSPDNFILTPTFGQKTGIGLGASFTWPGYLRYGLCSYRVSTNQDFILEFFAGSENVVMFSIQEAAGSYSGQFVAPKRSLLVKVTNSTVGAMDAFVNVVSENVKY